MGREKRNLLDDRDAHVFSRTISDIWFTDEDKELIVSTIRKYTKKNGYLIHYFTVLSNHFHLIHHFTLERSCAKEIKVLKQEISRAYNYRHRRRGPIWAERYQDVTIKGDDHYYRALVYDACNQTRAGIVASPFDERFSSFRALAFGEEDGITTPSPYYLDLAHAPKERQREFRDMVQFGWGAYADADAYTRKERGHSRFGSRKEWARDLRKLEEHEKEYLDKDQSQNPIVIHVAKPQDKLPDDATPPTDPSESIMLAPDERDELIRMGIPDRVLRLFYAPKDFIVDSVKENYLRYRLHAPPMNC